MLLNETVANAKRGPIWDHLMSAKNLDLKLDAGLAELLELQEGATLLEELGAPL